MTAKVNATRAQVAVLLALLGVAALLRFVGIEDRPLHHDEAINSIKLELLWQRGIYEYSPDGLHGPSLAYLSLPFVEASPARSYRQTTELTYRILPLVLGVALVLLTFALAPGLGLPAALVAAGLCAVSPAMVFYSRYYIHEMPLVVFGLLAIVSGWQLLERLGSRQPAWGAALGLGASLGLMHATKETFPIAVVAGGLALAASVRLQRPPRGFWPCALLAAAAAAIVSVAFFSSFFSHWQGPIDSVTTFASYLREGADGESVHRNPWWWYLELLVHERSGGLLFSSELVIVLLAAVGVVAAARRWGLDAEHVPLVRFFAVYTLALLAIYSAIPYKTPWCVLGALHGMIVLAGVGAVALARSARGPFARALLAVALLAGSAQLAQQNVLVNFRYAADERNPWVYAHALGDVRRLGTLVSSLASQQGAERPASLHVFDWTDNASLYFYLRGIPGVRFRSAGETSQASPQLDMLLIDEARRGELDERLEAEYHVERFQLRPNVWALLYVRRAAWEALEATRASPPPS